MIGFFFLLLLIIIFQYFHSAFGDLSLSESATQSNSTHRRIQRPQIVKPFVDLNPELSRYGAGHIVRIYGLLYDGNSTLGNGKITIDVKCMDPKPADPIPAFLNSLLNVAPHCGKGKTYAHKSLYTYDGKLNTSFTNTEEYGQYNIFASINDSNAIDGWSSIRIENYFSHAPVYLPFLVGIGSSVTLMLSLIYTCLRKYSGEKLLVHELIRFMSITGIALSPTFLFLITDVGVGLNSPIGLVIARPFDQGVSQPDEDQQLVRQWVIHIGGIQSNNYETGLNIPFILFQGDLSSNPYIAAAISFTLGLVTSEVIDGLISFARGRIPKRESDTKPLTFRDAGIG
jgi:hypothetical protein